MSSDAKQVLRKLEFPLCVKEALSRIEHICAANISNVERIHSVKQTDLAMELIAEFVFCEVDRKGVKKKRLNRIQEMQLLEVLSDYFAYSHNSNIGSDAARNAVFMSLFPYTYTERCQFLIKLISIAICTNNIPLLSATGVLMQQIGCTSKFSLELATGLINDYFISLPNSSTNLCNLPSKAPLFTANFLTALSEIYFTADSSGHVKILSVPLLNIVIQWISENLSLCYAAVTSNLLSSLPTGGIPMPAVTPFLGLFKWCVFAPLYVSENNNLYSKLHLAVLKSLLESDEYCASPCQRNIISIQHLIYLAVSCNDKVESIVNSKSFNENMQNQIQLCLERLAQFIQLALYSNCFYGNKQELLNRLKMLPSIPLIRIILSKHKEIL